MTDRWRTCSTSRTGSSSAWSEPSSRSCGRRRSRARDASGPTASTPSTCTCSRCRGARFRRGDRTAGSPRRRVARNQMHVSEIEELDHLALPSFFMAAIAVGDHLSSPARSQQIFATALVSMDADGHHLVRFVLDAVDATQIGAHHCSSFQQAQNCAIWSRR